MKASEVLKKYAAGTRNFQRVNLRGQSFKGKNLKGADFREADIRSANFTGATLRGAKFCGAKAGLQRRWIIILAIVSLLLSVLLGFFVAVISAWFAAFFTLETIEQYSIWPGIIILILLVVFVYCIFRQGLVGGVRVAFIGVILALVVGLAISTSAGGVAGAILAADVAVSAMIVLQILVVTVIVAATNVKAEANALAVVGIAAGVIIGARIMAERGAGAVGTPELGSVAGTVEGLPAMLAAAAGGVVVLLLNFYITRRTFTGDVLIGTVAIAFAATGGTSLTA